MSSDRLSRFGRRELSLGALAGLAAPALAQGSRQVQVVVPFPPGGALDAVARLIAQRVAESSGDTLIVENRPGANGNIGSRAVAQARPDGGTWLINSDGIATVNPTLYPRQMGFDPERNLQVVATIGAMPSILVVNPHTPWRSLAEFVAHARGTEVSYASGGVGSAGHLTMEYFGSVARLKLSHVPYRGGAPAMTDLIAGQVPVAFVAIGNAIDHVRSGALRALAVSSPERLATVPEAPTVGESGFPGFDVVTAFLAWVPAGTPAELASRISRQIRSALADPAVQSRIRSFGIDPMDRPPEEAARWLSEERRKWAALIAERGITAD